MRRSPTTGTGAPLGVAASKPNPKGREMIRNLKTLGVALAAVFAFSAVAASGAMAQTQGHLTSSTGVDFTLTGTEIAGGLNVFTGPLGINVKCPGSTYTGHKLTTTPHAFIASGETSTTITPKYVNCEEAGIPRTVDMNGCDYQIDDSTTTGGAGTYGVTVDIICPVGKEIVITGGACTVNVKGQTDVTGFHVTNQTGGHIRLHGSATVKASACGGLPVNVTQHQDVTITGHDTNKNKVNVSVSD